MKTEQLIDMLGTNLDPVKPGRLGKTLAWTLVLGWVAALVLMLATVGVQPDITDRENLGFLAVKLLFALSLIGSGTAFLARSIQPGRDTRRRFALAFVPIMVMGAAGLVTLVGQSPSAWESLILGTQWAACLACILFFSIIPFALLIWALRKGAPTNLKRTGAIAGLVAGALGAAAYALSSPDDSLPFIAIWFSAPILLGAFIGAMLGPRLLRW